MGRTQKQHSPTVKNDRRKVERRPMVERNPPEMAGFPCLREVYFLTYILGGLYESVIVSWY